MSRERVRCPACEDREALRNDGGAKVVGGGQLKGATKDVGVTTAASGCELCKSKGWISAKDVKALLIAGIDAPRLAEKDPYSYGIKPSAALLRRRTNP